MGAAPCREGSRGSLDGGGLTGMQTRQSDDEPSRPNKRLFSPPLSWLRPRVDGIQVEITTACNAVCRYCPHTVYRRQWTDRHLSRETFTLVDLARQAGPSCSVPLSAGKGPRAIARSPLDRFCETNTPEKNPPRRIIGQTIRCWGTRDSPRGR